MSARSAARSVELNRLSMCQPGNTVETVELRKKFSETYTDRDECQAPLNQLRTPISAQFTSKLERVFDFLDVSSSACFLER